MKVSFLTLLLGLVPGATKAASGVNLRRRLAGDSVQPSTYTHTMRVGETDTIDKTVTIGEEVTTAKVDVFFLTDSTGSMGGLISSVRASASDILARTSTLGDVAYGVGEYRDIGDVFIYLMNQDITTDQGAVSAAINTWNAGGGGDWPEANLFALHEVAQDTSWRDDSFRILVWFGDAPGHDPRNGVSLSDAIGELVDNSIVVQALDLRYLDYTDQATAVASATGGRLYSGVNTDDIVDAITTAITDVFAEYTTVALQPDIVPGVQVNTSPLAWSDGYSREYEESFNFEVTFECLEEGDHDFEIRVIVDGGLVATETDTIVCLPANEPPVALCDSVTVPAVTDCAALADIDAGSYDPDDDPITLTQDPPGPYPLGETTVVLTVTDDEGEIADCTATVTVTDDEPLDGNLIDCGTDGVIAPPCVPVSFTPSSPDKKTNGCDLTYHGISGGTYGCKFCNGANKVVDKLAGGSCIVSTDGSVFTIDDSGGVGDHIHYDVMVEDVNGATLIKTCTICVDNPSQHDCGGRNKLRRGLAPGNGNGNGNGNGGGGGFTCPDDWIPENPFDVNCGL